MIKQSILKKDDAVVANESVNEKKCNTYIILIVIKKLVQNQAIQTGMLIIMQ